MTLNLDAIKQRIKSIIETDMKTDTTVYATAYIVEPDIAELKLPGAVLFTGTLDSPFVSGSEGRHDVNIEVYWLVREAPGGLKSVRVFEVDGVLQDFLTAFMSRPRLQLNDNGLAFVQGDIRLIPTIRPTSQVITYPIGASDGIPYRGFQSRLIVPYRVSYPMRA